MTPDRWLTLCPVCKEVVDRLPHLGCPESTPIAPTDITDFDQQRPPHVPLED